MRVLYLHGFASSSASSKAGHFAAGLRADGIALETPDFNQPDFSTLTITRMIDQSVDLIISRPPEPVALIGSSLGAFVAIQVALRLQADAARRIDRLVLLAPALDFGTREAFTLGDRTLAEWKQTGITNVFHYGFGRLLPVRYELYTDACQYNCVEASLWIPILVFQGTRDEVVDPATVVAWCSRRPNAELRLLDDDHQLGASVPLMTDAVRVFLRAPRSKQL